MLILYLVATLLQIVNARNITITRLERNYSSPYYCQFCTCLDDNMLIDCSDKGLYRPPRDMHENSTVVLLFGNIIKTVKTEYFAGMRKLRLLHLANNTITTIRAGAFQDLESLEVLYLDGNLMYMFQRFFQPGMFTGLGNLKVLTLNRNVKTDLDSRLDVKSMDDVFKDLTSLETLYIDGTHNIKFKDPFKPLTNLTKLIIADNYARYFCNIGTITADAFEGLPNLRYLTIRSCNVTKIEAGAFWGLSHLSHLDLSWNVDLGFRELGRAMEGLQWSNLTELYINAIHSPLRAGTDLERADVRYLRRMPLREVHMNDNGIEYVHYGALSMFPTSLRYLYMKRNRLRFGMYMEEVIFNNQGLLVFDASEQEVGVRSNLRSPFKGVERENGYIMKRDTAAVDKLRTKGDPEAYDAVHITTRDNDAANHIHASRDKVVDIAGSIIKRDTSKVNMFHSPQDPDFDFDSRPLARKERSYDLEVITLSLQRISCSGSTSDMHPLNFTKTINNITYMDLSRNHIPVLKEGAFLDLPVLTELNLSSNSIEYLHKKTFQGLANLQLLDLSNNLMGNALSLDVLGEIFSPLKQLQYLNLAHNRIYFIEKNVFIYLKHLRVIDLSRNNLRTIDVDFSHNGFLENIDLTLNRITTIQERTRTGLNKIAKNQQITISLFQNYLGCKCETITFLKWLLNSQIYFEKRDDYVCTFNNGSVTSLADMPELINFLEEECADYTVYIVAGATGGTFIVSLILSYIVYMNRWKLRYMYYMAKAKLAVDGKENFQDMRFDFDAFLSYADGDRHFVIQQFVEEVERKGGLRLNVRDRDFELGESVAINISKAIRTSKKTILFLSRHFLRNKWCNFEMNMALMEGVHTQRTVILVIFLEEIPAKLMPLDLINILKDAPKTDLPKEEHLKPAFWKRCLEICHD